MNDAWSASHPGALALDVVDAMRSFNPRDGHMAVWIADCLAARGWICPERLRASLPVEEST